MDRENVIKGFELCHTPGMNCKYCPYNSLPDNENCNDTLVRDVLALLKEQPEIVRCKDCELHEMRGEMLLCKAEDKPHTYDWFCAGGRKKDDDG
jgi:hypothetical protein